jgi:hypothetical protein
MDNEQFVDRMVAIEDAMKEIDSLVRNNRRLQIATLISLQKTLTKLRSHSVVVVPEKKPTKRVHKDRPVTPQFKINTRSLISPRDANVNIRPPSR